MKGEPLAFVSGHNRRMVDPLRRVVQAVGCWAWTGGHDRKGYGRCQVNRRHTGAHRVVYEALIAPIPPGMTIDHLCLNTACVNPEHMEVVSRSENCRRQAVARRSPQLEEVSA